VFPDGRGSKYQAPGKGLFSLLFFFISKGMASAPAKTMPLWTVWPKAFAFGFYI